MPHSVVLSECSNTLWVADRERMAVRAIDSETGVEKKRFPMAEGGYPYSLTQDELTGRVYALVWARPRSGVGGKVWMADVLAGTTVELPGVSVPHDFVVSYDVYDDTYRVYVGETGPGASGRVSVYSVDGLEKQDFAQALKERRIVAHGV